jgi:hypothetical protein
VVAGLGVRGPLFHSMLTEWVVSVEKLHEVILNDGEMVLVAPPPTIIVDCLVLSPPTPGTSYHTITRDSTRGSRSTAAVQLQQDVKHLWSTSKS